MENIYTELLCNVFTSCDNLSIKKICGGGSQREFFRISGDGRSVILCRANKLDEMADHIDITFFLKKYSIPVPEIYDYNKEKGFVIFEDGGRVSLLDTIQNLHDKGIIAIYKKIINHLINLQTLDPYECPAISKRIFDKEYYRWETDYFLQSCVEKVFHLTGNNELLAEFDRLAESLTGEKMVIVHRDFQSQNIQIKGDDVYFLDYQSARPGVCQYDLASLLYDPYGNLSGNIRNELLEYYYHNALHNGLVPQNKEIFLQTFYRASLQRIMQAMGAYGFLGLVRGKKQFLKYIEPGKHILWEIISGFSDYPALADLINKIISIDHNSNIM